MKKLSTKETVQLGKDLNAAKIIVLVKWGFSIEEIAQIMCMTERAINKIIKAYDILEFE